MHCCSCQFSDLKPGYRLSFIPFTKKTKQERHQTFDCCFSSPFHRLLVEANNDVFGTTDSKQTWKKNKKGFAYPVSGYSLTFKDNRWFLQWSCVLVVKLLPKVHYNLLTDHTSVTSCHCPLSTSAT